MILEDFGRSKVAQDGKPLYSSNKTFVKDVILNDIDVRKMCRRWEEVQRAHPGVTCNSFKLWTISVWRTWVYERLKTCTRRFKGSRKVIKVKRETVPKESSSLAETWGPISATRTLS